LLCRPHLFAVGDKNHTALPEMVWQHTLYVWVAVEEEAWEGAMSAVEECVLHATTAQISLLPLAAEGTPSLICKYSTFPGPNCSFRSLTAHLVYFPHIDCSKKRYFCEKQQ
jgi:hypothetical protein